MEKGDTASRLEPDLNIASARGLETSIAISLKRIADALQEQNRILNEMYATGNHGNR